MKVIKITVDDKLSIVDADNSFACICNLLPDSDGIDFVKPRFTERGTVFAFDKGGKLKGLAENTAASIMYGYPEVAPTCIVGDVLVMKYVFNQYRLTYVPLSDSEAEERAVKLLKEFKFLKKV